MKTTMQAVGVLPHRKEVRLLAHAHPQLHEDHHVKVRVLDVGICGTDRDICSFAYGFPPPGSDYLVVGHESLGQVIEVGANVRRFKVGDLVVPSVRRPCPRDHCRPCREDRQDFCSTGDYIERGIKELHGYMTETFVEDEKFLSLVPAGLRDTAVLCEPLTIAEKGLTQALQIQQRLPWGGNATRPGQGLRAVVLGAGPIGILGAMKLVIEGFETIVYSRSPKPNAKAELIESIGARYVSIRDVSPEALPDVIGSYDLVYEGVGQSEISFQVLYQMGINGVYIFTGLPHAHGDIRIPGDELMRRIVLKNLAVVGTVNADRASFEGAIRDLGEFQKRWPDAVKRIITSRHRVDHYRQLLLDKATGIKNVISFD